MTTASSILTPLTCSSNGYGDFPPPPWVADIFGLRHDSKATQTAAEDVSLRISRVDGAVLATARVCRAVSGGAALFQQHVACAYRAIRDEIRSIGNYYPIRFWNYIPSIHDGMSDGRDRYMVFNAGRFDAFCDWYGGAQAFDQHLPTATGVGHDGADFVVHCLAASQPGVAIANPRQVQPFHYSQRFGPLPPCFARATIIGSPARLVLVGGTASIRGEDSLHALDFTGQLGETLANLAAMVHVASGNPSAPHAGDLSHLRRYRDLRVYLADTHRAGVVNRDIADFFPNLRHLEMVQADLCRAELLIEIEGVADLASS